MRSILQLLNYRLARILLATTWWIAIVTNGNAGQVQPNYRASVVDEVRIAAAEGRLSEVFARLERDARNAEGSGRLVDAAIFYSAASIAARWLGQLQKSLTYATRTVELATNAGDADLQARGAMNSYHVLSALGRHSEGRQWLRRGIDVVKLIRRRDVREARLASLFNYMGRDLLRTGEIREALNYFSASVGLREGLIERLKAAKAPNLESNLDLLVYDLIGLGLAYERARRLEEARQTYEKCLAISTKSTSSHYRLGQVYERLGNIYFQQHDHTRAEAYLLKSLEFSRSSRLSGVITSSSVALGDILQRRGRTTEAILHYRNAIERIESTRSLIESEDFRLSFFGGKGAVYNKIIRSHIETGNFAAAFDYNERARSRAFLDLIGSKALLTRARDDLLAEERSLQEQIAIIRSKTLTDPEHESDQRALFEQMQQVEEAYSQFLSKVRAESKEQSTLMSVEPLNHREVQNLLDPGVTMLEYYVAPTEVYLWVIKREELRFITIPVGRRNLVSRVNALRDGISNPDRLELLQRFSRELFRLLVEPALAHATGKELVIVPHDVLHYLPFQALTFSDGKFLIENFAIRYLSSASLMQFTREKKRAENQKVLGFGNPDLDDPAKQLEFAEIEAREITTIYPLARIFLGKEATEEKTKHLAPEYDVLHFATHAELKEDDPLASAVLLARSSREDGRLEIREIFGMKLNADMVVLSGCETGLGKLSTGDELVGLSRAFMYAGTPSVVASLWKVDDASTARLMADFYKNLRTMTKVEALRQAQLTLVRAEEAGDLVARRGVGGIAKLGEASRRASAQMSLRHPYFWAAFNLVGDSK